MSIDFFANDVALSAMQKGEEDSIECNGDMFVSRDITRCNVIQCDITCYHVMAWTSIRIILAVLISDHDSITLSLI